MNPSLRTLGYLQWLGLLVGAAVFALSHLTGWWITQAECNTPGDRRGIGNDVWMIALTAGSALAVIGAGIASAIVFHRTRGAEPGDGPVDASPERPAEPYGRLQFFAAAALVANVIFLGVVVLNGLGAVLNSVCRQS